MSAKFQTYWQSAIAFATGHAPQPLGSAHPLNAPYQALNDDQRFSSNAKRMKNLPVLIETPNSYLIKDTTQNWLKRMDIF